MVKPASDFDDVLVACLSRIESDGHAALEAVCGEYPDYAEQLRERVDLLREAGLLATLAESADEGFPEQLGDFRLIERLGAGGMGVVYLAEQVSLGRRVALKLIRPEHMYFPGARTRFAREVDAVARLAHPGIVPVHVVGEESGIPFFAMELVGGASLEQVLAPLRGRRPDELEGSDLAATVERVSGAEVERDVAPFDLSWSDACLWVAREIAQALEHAHQRGVLHRDVKPSNVMLTPDGRVLLLDFGLATAEGTDALTRTGTQLGSLPYMAPEQVEGRGADVGVGADVYGLGVLLFELLALRRPFAAETVEALRAEILQARPQRLGGGSRDLEAVVSTAMAPELARRYASAADLARELTRLLDRRPVEARPAGPWVQLVRWTQRNRGAAAAAALGLVVVVAGPLVFGLQQMRLTERIESEKKTADEQRARAERHLAQALEAVDVMLTQVGDETLENVPQLTSVRLELLEAARAFFGRLDAYDSADPDVRRRRVGVGLSLAALDGLVGNREAAAAELSEMTALLRGLIDELEDAAVERSQLGLALARLAGLEGQAGRSERALAHAREADEQLRASGLDTRAVRRARLEALHAWSESLVALGRTDEARALNERAIELGRGWVAADPDDTRVRRNLATQLNSMGRVFLAADAARAVEPLREGGEHLRALMESDAWNGVLAANFCENRINLELALTTLGRADEAFEVVEEGMQVAFDLVRDFPSVTRHRRNLSLLRVNYGLALSNRGRAEEAVVVLGHAVELFEQIAADDPGDIENLHHLGGALSNLGAVLQELERTDESAEPVRRAVEIHRRVVAAQPDSPFYRYHLGVALINHGAQVGWDGDYDAMAAHLEEALPLLTMSVDAQSYVASYWMTVAEGLVTDPAVSAERRVELVERCHRGALDALDAAERNGYRDAAGLRSAATWAPLRDRPEFDELLARMGG